MTNKNFEIIIRYNSWNVSIFDNENNLLTELNCKTKWFSNYYLGNANINGSLFSLVPDENGISLKSNNFNVGQVKVSSFGLLGNVAYIEINKELYTLRRENLKERFTVVKGDECIIIDSKLYKEKQKNLFGLVYFDDKLFYSVSMSDYRANKLDTLQILVVCGYCIRIFQSLRMGE